jgi:hypothetical protein
MSLTVTRAPSNEERAAERFAKLLNAAKSAPDPVSFGWLARAGQVREQEQDPQRIGWVAHRMVVLEEEYS